MNTIRTIATIFALLLTFSGFSQVNKTVADLNFKLKKMSDNVTWGVFVVPGESIVPSKKTVTGTGQVTIVAPVGFTYANLENHGGSWIENARVDGPMEAPGMSYISFGFVSDEPRIKYVSGVETLLFAFVPESNTTGFFLIDNVNDPFSTPNTYGSNPGNDLGAIDFGSNSMMVAYNYGTNLKGDEVMPEPTSVFASSQNINQEKANENFKVILASEKLPVTGQ